MAALDVDKILEKSIEAPVKPNLSDNMLDVSNFDAAFTGEEAIISVANQKQMNKIRSGAA